MTLELRKYNLIEFLMAIRDEALLAQIEEIHRKARIAAYEAMLRPMTKEQYIQEIMEAEEDVKAGRLIDAEDLLKEVLK